METGTRLTAALAIQYIGELIASGDDREALTYWNKIEPDLRDRMTSTEFHRICGLLESAALAVSLECDQPTP